MIDERICFTGECLLTREFFPLKDEKLETYAALHEKIQSAVLDRLGE